MAKQPTLKPADMVPASPTSASTEALVPESHLVIPDTSYVDEAKVSPRFEIVDQLCESCGYQLRGARSIRCPECACVIPRPLSSDAAAEIRRSKHAIWNRVNPWLWLLGICGAVSAVGFAPRMFALSAIRGVAVSLIFLSTLLIVIAWRKLKAVIHQKPTWRVAAEGLGLISLSVLILMMTSSLALML